MNQKLRTVILIALAVVVTIILIMVMKSMGSKPPEKAAGESERGVEVMALIPDTNEAIISLSGKLLAEKRIELFAEVVGVLQNDNFKQGNRFNKGEPLVVIEGTEARNNLKAQRSQLLNLVAGVMGDLSIDFKEDVDDWQEFLDNIDVNATLPEMPEINNKQLKRFLAGRNVLNTYYTVKAQESRVAKYTIAAPYKGVLTEADVRKGTLVRSGQKLGEFIGDDSFELKTEVSVSDLKYIKVGDKVALHSDDLNKTWMGKVSRINDKMESGSQLVVIYVSVTGKDLKEGMYLRGNIKGNIYPNTVMMPRKLIIDGSVLVVENGRIKVKHVDVKHIGSSNAIVGGLTASDRVIKFRSKGLYEGQKVQIIKSAKP